ncbi:peptidoglycan D,D-transpeptidase FtsI family protein [Cryptosporangium aurantiacum]|uniref:Peptidoglycan synthetase FtsI n=1 Tax=Cryptosporangium aurantiacum TaxID=134849 RepID=A0A1M7I473_9ACTN|nr:penicillin-binding protein 2 [Cryptosporangium aurantiacum]SHM35554.1 peptidoglycan synthetase FtsI [Cryptosporangium aurantiacum]
MAAQPPRDGRRAAGRRSGASGRKAGDAENVVPLRPRRSRLAESQQYHPRGRTVRESAEHRGRESAERRGRESAERRTRGRAEQQPRKPRPPAATRVRHADRARRAAGSPPPRRRPRVHVPPPRPPRKRNIARLGNPSARLRVSLAVLLALFLVVGGRLVQIQTTEGSQYATMAATDRRVSEELYAPRGAILDRDGNVLAHDVQGATIAADPGYIKDEAEVAAAVAPLLGMTPAEVEKKLARRTHADGTLNRYVVLKKKVPLAVGDAVNRLRTKIPGLIVQDDQVREVPGGDLAANVVGRTGTEGTGLAGLEAGYNTVLQGVNGERVYDKGTGGQEIPDGYHRTTAAKAGSDLVLTLDRDLQYQANKLLKERLAATKAWNGSAIVMDVETGEILAMVSADTTDAKKKGTSLDLATAAVVEPGSVHKALTIAGGLDSGVIEPNSVLTLPETIEKGGVTYRDTHDHGSPRYTLMGILAQSSNIGTIMVADKLGPQRLYDYQRAFGLGTRTGIGLPGESRGIVQPPQNWSGPSAGSIPIGLGVAATPLQMTALYATLANGGMKVQPLLVKSVVGADGTVRATERAEPERVVSEEAAKTVVRDMTAIATAEGTAPLAAVPGYLVAGKTGTGKRAEGNKYMDGNVTSFIGIVPADNPRYVISVFIHTPEGVGGAIAGPMFSDLAGFTLRRYGVSPSGAAAPPITLYG